MNNEVNMNINIAVIPNVECEKCGGEIFKEACVIKRVSPLMSPTGQETVIPVGTFMCAACGHVNAQFMPPSPPKEQKTSSLVI